MKKTSGKGNPAFKSMFTLALYLVLLIGMWSVISYVAFPDQGKGNSVSGLVTANAPLLKQAAENVLEPEQWAGVQETPEVRALYEKIGIASQLSEDGMAKFILKNENASVLAYIAYAPGGEFVLPEGDWRAAEQGGKSVRWEDGARYIVVNQIADGFYLAEENMAPQKVG